MTFAPASCVDPQEDGLRNMTCVVAPPFRILFLHSASKIGGGNKVLLGLLEGLDRSRFQPLSLIPEPGPLEQELRSRDTPYVVVDYRPGSWTHFSMAKAFLRIRYLCLRHRINLIHANDPATYRAASLAAPPGIPRMCTVHHPGQTRESLEWAFRRHPSLVTTPSHFMRQQVKDCVDAPINRRIEVVWNSIDTDWFRPTDDTPALKRRLGLDPGGFDLTIVAAVSPHKGHRCFLRAARLVLNSHPRTSFHIIGGAGPRHAEYVASLRQLAAELGIEQRIRFWGFIEDKLARDLLQASDLFLLPTREEGFGLSIAEAQACQVPVLTSAMQPIDEVVDDGRTGYLLDPEDHVSFAQKAIELLDSADARLKMGLAGRTWVIERFGRRSYIERVESLYTRLFHQGTPLANRPASEWTGGKLEKASATSDSCAR
jgi:L-malate glycosyltransferase